MKSKMLLVLFAHTLMMFSAIAAKSQKRRGPAIPEDGALVNAAQTSLGATGTFTGAPNNKDWSANVALQPDNLKHFRGGCLFGAPMEGGTIHINLVIPCDIERIDLMQLDYRGTMNVKIAEVYVDDKLITTLDLPENPGYYQSFPLKAKGQRVSVKCAKTHPPMKLENGSKGPNWGGWARIRVLVKNDIRALMQTPDAYKTEVVTNAIALSGCIKPGETKVYGEPRIAKGHPCTAWDSVDVERLKKMMKTSPELKKQSEALRRAMNILITKPISVPQPEKDDNGNWKHLTNVDKKHNQLSLDIANLGAAYQLFGDEKYAEHCKKILLAYADAWPKYGVGARHGFSHDPSKVFDQRLGDATWLLQVAVGYDCIHDWKGITSSEREHIEKDLVVGSADFIRQNPAHLRAPTNWSAIGTAAILCAGYACENEDLINTGLYGVNYYRNKNYAKNPPNKWWEGTPNKNPSGVELHFSEKTIDIDGMWSEGAIGYQFMALQALVIDAEILWHHGIDLYRYRNCALKRIFDSPLYYAYPNLVGPAIHDSGNSSIVGREGYLYEYGYWRYRDPRYLQVLSRTGRRLSAAFQQFTVSTLFDLDIENEYTPYTPESVNLNGVGYGILRLTDGDGSRNLLLDYGPNRSHGHPDKLNIDLWAFGNLQIPDPGTVWYEDPAYKKWFRTTFAHNTLSVDMQEQQACGAELLVFAPGDAHAMQRGRTDEAYSGVMMDRSLFMTRNYVADLFGAFSRMKRVYDLAWHPLGECIEKDLGDLKKFELPEPRYMGYCMLENMMSSENNGGTKLKYNNKGRILSIITPKCEEKVRNVIGEVTLSKSNGMQTPYFQRRETDSTVFGTVIDYSNNDAVLDVRQKGSVKDGWIQLDIKTKDTRDRCFAAFRPAVVKWTDAQQLFSSLDKNGHITSLIVGGGTFAEINDAKIKLSELGSFSVERTETGSYIIKNLAPVALKADVVFGKVRKVYDLTAGEVREYVPTGAKSIVEYRKAELKRLKEEEARSEAKLKAERAARAKVRAEDIKKFKVPVNTVVAVQGEDFVGQGGGQVRIASNKTAAIGKAFSNWDCEDHWLEWKVSLPAEGYYGIALCYCCDNPRKRHVMVNGVSDEDGSISAFAATGGFANGSDDWVLKSFADPDNNEKPMLYKFKAGENIIRMANIGGGGVNIDYIYVFSPDAKLERLKK